MDLIDNNIKLLNNNIKLLELHGKYIIDNKLLNASKKVNKINKILLCDDCYNNNLDLINLKINYPNDYYSKNCITCGKDVKNMYLRSVTEYFSEFLKDFNCDYEKMVIRFHSYIVMNNIIFKTRFEYGNSLLHHACKSCDLEIIKLLLKFININTLNDENQNCLHYLLGNWYNVRMNTSREMYLNKKIKCIEYLYPKINKNKKDIFGNNYLQILFDSFNYSYCDSFYKIINLLTKTDIFNRNNKNLMILDIVVIKEQFTIAQKINNLMIVYYRKILKKIFCKDLVNNILFYIDKIPIKYKKIPKTYSSDSYFSDIEFNGDIRARCLIS